MMTQLNRSIGSTGYRPSPSVRLQRIVTTAVLEIILAVVGVSMATPFVWMVTTSLKSRSQVFLYPPQIIPRPVLWSNFVEVWTREAPMVSAYLNSLKITSLVTIGTLISCALAAYAFAKIRFPGSGFLFGALLATMMIPSQVTLVPVYILMARIGWVDTHWPLIIPPVMTNAFGVFLLRQFFLTIPDELLDAARIDGANPFHMFTRVALPLVKPALVTLGIFIMLGSWNSFLPPLIYLNTADKFTIPLVINYFQSLTTGPEWEIMMAAITTALAPMLLAYLFAQRYFIESIALTGMKGI
jgi:multiple sugar transport system permease protein